MGKIWIGLDRTRPDHGSDHRFDHRSDQGKTIKIINLQIYVIR